MSFVLRITIALVLLPTILSSLVRANPGDPCPPHHLRQAKIQLTAADQLTELEVTQPWIKAVSALPGGGYRITFHPVRSKTGRPNHFGAGAELRKVSPEFDTLYMTGYSSNSGTRHLYRLKPGELVYKRQEELFISLPYRESGGMDEQIVDIRFPPGSSSERILHFIGSQKLLNITEWKRLGQGTFGVGYKVTYAKGKGITEVIKIINPTDLEAKHPDRVSAVMTFADLVNYSIAEQILGRMMFRGERLIYNARIVGHPSDLAQGTVRTEFLEGLDLRDLALAADVVLAPGAPKPSAKKMTMPEAVALLKKAGFQDADHPTPRDAALETIQYLAAAEEAYRLGHTDALNAQRDAGSSAILNRRFEKGKKDAVVGLDYGHGGNLKWIPNLHAFGRFD